MRKKIIKILTIFLMSTILTACGATRDNLEDTTIKTAKEVALDKIIKYAQTDGASMAPTIEDYKEADILVGSEEKLKKINEVVSKLTKEDVDTAQEIQRLEENIDDEGNIDSTKPVIIINGDSMINLTVGDSYIDAGATASDDIDEDITAEIEIVSNVDTTKEGTYRVKYRVKDSAGNSAEVIRVVRVTKIKILSALDFSNVGAKPDDNISSAANKIVGTTYYFSSSKGDDKNDGLSPQKPKKTLRASKILFYKINPGDGILFKRGDVWSAQSEDFGILTYLINGTPGKPKVLSCYGEGPRPKFSGLVSHNSDVWTDIGDGIWKTTPSFNKTVRIPSLLINGKFAKESHTRLDWLKKDKSFKWFHDTTNGELYISVDPSTVDIRYPDASGVIVFKTGSSYIIVDNLNIEFVRNRAISAPNALSHSIISNNTVGRGSGFGMSVGGSNLKIINNIVDAGYPKFNYDKTDITVIGPYEGIRYWGGNGEKNVEIAYNTISGFTHANVTVNGGDPKKNGPALIAPKVHHNFFDGRTTNYGGKLSVQFDVDGIEVYNNVFMKGSQNQLTGDNGHYHHNILIEKTDSLSTRKPYNTGSGFGLNLQKSFNNNLFEYNIFFRTAGEGIRLSSKSDAQSVHGNIIRENIFFDTCQKFVVYPSHPSDIAVNLVDDPSNTKRVTDTIVQNNIIYNSKGVTKTLAFSLETRINNASSTFSVDYANQNSPMSGNNRFINNNASRPDFVDAESFDFRAVSGGNIEELNLLDGFEYE